MNATITDMLQGFMFKSLHVELNVDTKEYDIVLYGIVIGSRPSQIEAVLVYQEVRKQLEEGLRNALAAAAESPGFQGQKVNPVGDNPAHPGAQPVRAPSDSGK